MTRDDVRTVIGSALYPTDPDVANAEAEAVLAALAAAGLVIGERAELRLIPFPPMSDGERVAVNDSDLSDIGLALVRVVG